MAIMLEPGTIVAGRYRLDRVLGEGGMGVVWAATHAITRRTVAMKFVRNTLRQKTELRRRLLREAHAAAAVRHPHVVEILDVFELDSDTPVIVMALLQGETLGQYLAREQRLTLADAAGVLSPAISAIGTAHARGIVHRDLKPDNIYLAEEAQGKWVKVLDFGIAKLQDPEHAGHDSMSTQTGSTLGTPAYMAPEQAAGERDVDHRADIWALGVIAYECLSGVRPIEGENAGQVVMRLMTTGITPLARVTRGLPQDVTSLVDRMLSRERSRRPQDLREAQSIFARYTSVTVPEFGEPRSELATTFDGASPRPSEPDALSRSTPPEPQLAELVNAASPLTGTLQAPAPPRLRRPNRLKLLSLVGAPLLGVLTWFVIDRAAPSGPVVVTTHAALSSSSAAPTAVAVAGPDVRIREESAAASAVAISRSHDDVSPPSSAVTPKQAPRTVAQKQSAPATVDVAASLPAAKELSLPVASASASAHAEAAPRHRGGLVDEVPF